MKNEWYYIGMIWGAGHLNQENFLIRHKRKATMVQILEYVNSVYAKPSYSLVWIESKEKGYYQTKVHLFNPKIYYIVNDLGFKGRKDEQRNPPKLLPDHHIHDFLMGYSQTGHWTYEEKRLRFYGHESILTMYNDHIHKVFGRKIMKLQNHKQSEIMKVLYYQGKGIQEIAAYFEIWERRESYEDCRFDQ